MAKTKIRHGEFDLGNYGTVKITFYVDENHKITAEVEKVQADYKSKMLTEKEKIIEQLRQNPLELGRVVTGLDLSVSNLLGVQFINCLGESANFSACLLRGSRFDNALLDGANFENAELRYCSFRNAKLTNVNFDSETDLQHANFAGADMRGVIMNENTSLLYEAEFDKETILPWGKESEKTARSLGMIKIDERGRPLSNWQRPYIPRRGLP